MIRVAVAAYPLDPVADWAAYEAKLADWIARAEADVLVFPEYAAMERAALAGPDVAQDAERCLWAVAESADRAADLVSSLARRHAVTVLAGSGPEQGHGPGNRPVNRARLFGPEGPIGYQDKLILTPYERAQLNLAAGDHWQVFDTPVGRVGILICYDAEFPLVARAMVEAGAQILLVPSCTDTPAGYARVRVGAMARALEGQCVVLQAPTVGPAGWCPVVDENTGAAGVFGPPDVGFPATGVIAEGDLDKSGWVRADIDPAAIRTVREAGQVLNVAHWPEQAALAGAKRGA